MLDDLNGFLDRTRRTSTMSMIRLNSYIQNLTDGTESVIARNNRFTQDPIPSAGIDFINSMIVRADIPYLLKFNNDVDRLGAVSREYASPVYSDFIRQHPQRRRFFIGGSAIHTTEYVTITEDLEGRLPVGCDIGEWMRVVRPFRVIDYDSFEYRFDVVSSKLRFNYEPPNSAVFSLNITKLLMLYTKYRLTYPERFEDRINNFPFIFDTCINNMLYDNNRIMLLNMYFEIISNKLVNKNYTFDSEQIIYSQFSHFIKNNREAAIGEIQNMIDRCTNSRMRPDELLVNLKIDVDMSLYDYLRWLPDGWYVGSGGTQFSWIEFIIQYKALSLLLMIYSLQPDSHRTKELYKLFRIMSRRLRNTRFWAHARNPVLVDILKSNFEYLVDLCG